MPENQLITDRQQLIDLIKNQGFDLFEEFGDFIAAKYTSHPVIYRSVSAELVKGCIEDETLIVSPNQFTRDTTRYQLHHWFFGTPGVETPKFARLYGKYHVVKSADGSVVDGDVFVLRLDRDAHARAAARAYAHSVHSENPDLAREIEEWLRQIGHNLDPNYGQH